MIIFAVNQCREAIPRVRLDALPDVEDRATRRVHEHAADRAQPLEVAHGHAECRKNDDVVGADSAEVEISVPPLGSMQELDAHGGKLLIDVRVVNDLAYEERALGGKL